MGEMTSLRGGDKIVLSLIVLLLELLLLIVLLLLTLLLLKYIRNAIFSSALLLTLSGRTDQQSSQCLWLLRRKLESELPVSVSVRERHSQV